MNGKRYKAKDGTVYMIIEEYIGIDEKTGESEYQYRVINQSQGILLDASISVPRFAPNGKLHLLYLLEQVEEVEIVEELGRFE